VIVSILAGQGSPVMWAAQHRHHHKHTDTELDTHSPRESKLLAFGFWMWLGYDWFFTKKKIRTIPVDLLRDPLIKWVDKFYYLIWATIIGVSLLISWKFCVFIVLAPLVWGFINMGLITCATHLKLPGSYKNYERQDDSYNNKLINLYLMGDALHNNHHEKPNECNEAHRQGELDLAYLFIKKFLSS
jgi:stearoyl-CoA desaturase (delta-9 desaturase)